MDERKIRTTEEREFFRINDQVEFAYCELNSATDTGQKYLEKLFSNDSYEHFQLMQEWQDMEKQGRDMLGAITRRIPEAADYLALMNRKYESLAHHIFYAYQRETSDINVSAGGIAFEQKEDMKVGTLLKVKLIFRPSFQGILIDAKVVHTRYLPKRNPEHPYLIALEFLNPDAEEQRIINHHVMNRQVEDIRSKKKR